MSPSSADRMTCFRGPQRKSNRWKASASKAKVYCSRRPRFEQLEDRQLLAADPLVASWGLPRCDELGTRFFPSPSTVQVNDQTFVEDWSTAGSLALTGDVNGDDSLELVVGDGSAVRAYAPDRSLLWEVSDAGALNIVADVTGDGVPEILTSKTEGNTLMLSIYDGSGLLVQQLTTNGTPQFQGSGPGWGVGITAHAAVDLDGDGDMEIVASKGAGYNLQPRGIVVFDYNTGQEEWYQSIGPSARDVAIGNVTGGPEAEILYASGGPANGSQGSDGTGDYYSYAFADNFNHQPSPHLWARQFEGSGFVDSNLALADLEGDGQLDIVVSSTSHGWNHWDGNLGRVYLLDPATGNTRPGYEHNFGMPVEVAGIADLNGDGRLEILVSIKNGQSQTGSLAVLSAAAGFPMLQEFSLPGSTLAVDAINDLNGDGRLEVVAHTNGPSTDSTLYVLDHQLRQLWTWHPGGNISAAIVSDLEGDLANELIVSHAGTISILAGNESPQILSLTPSPDTVDEGSEVVLVGVFSDRDSQDPFTASVNWGDGTTSPATIDPIYQTFAATHVYADDNPSGTPADDYTITVTLSDGAGSDTTTTTVTVNNVAPTVEIIGAPTQSPEGTPIILSSHVTDPGTADTFTYAWTVTKNGVLYATGDQPTITFTPDDNGTYDVSLVVRDDDALAEAYWEPGPHMLSPRTGPAVTLGRDGYIYAVGGVTDGFGVGAVTNTAERFDEATGSWEWIAPMIEKRHLAGAVTDSQGRIWVTGGYNLGAVLGSVEVYDPASNTWAPATNHLNIARTNHGIAATNNGYIYVFGGGTWEGSGSLEPLASMERYDLANALDGRWETESVPSMNEPRNGPGVAVDSRGRIYAIGGDRGPNIASVERYDPARNVWEYVAPLPIAVGSPAAFGLNGEIYVVGGGYPYVSNCYIYSPETNTWRAGPSMYEAVGLARAAVGPSGIAYDIGGEGSDVWAHDRVAMLTVPSGIASQTITVTNVAPTAGIRGDSFGDPVPVAIDWNLAESPWKPCLTKDGQQISFKKFDPHQVYTALWNEGLQQWEDVTAVTGLGQTWTSASCISPDEQWLFYVGSPGVGCTIYRSPWLGDHWGPGQPIDTVNAPFAGTNDPFFGTAPDGTGNRLYFRGQLTLTDEATDIYYSDYDPLTDSFGAPVKLAVSSSVEDGSPRVTSDGQILFWHSQRPGGYGGLDIWMAKWDSASQTWGAPRNLGPRVNGSGNETFPSYNSARDSLYFVDGAGRLVESLMVPETSVFEGSTVSLRGTVTDVSSVDKAAGFQCIWDVAKGHDGVTTEHYATGSGADFAFTPDDDGTYTVTLVAMDKDGGASLPASQTITVTNVAPTVEAGADRQAWPNEELVLDTPTFTDAGTLDTHQAWIDWDEGNGFEPVDVVENGGSGQVIGRHTYTGHGVCTVTVKVQDDDGGWSTDTLSVTVGRRELIGNVTGAHPAGWTFNDVVDGDLVRPVFNGPNGHAELWFDHAGNLVAIDFLSTTASTNLTMSVSRARSRGNARLNLGELTANTPMGILGLQSVDMVGAGVETTSTVRSLTLGNIANGADLLFGGGLTDTLSISAGTIGADVDLVFGGRLGYLAAKSWAGGTIRVASVGNISIRGDFGAAIVIDPAKSPSGGFNTIAIAGGDFLGSIDVPGSGGTITVMPDRYGRGGNLHASRLHVGGGVQRIETFGGDIALSGLTIDRGGLTLVANEAFLGGVWRGGNITLQGDASIGGTVWVQACGGDFTIRNQVAVHGDMTRLMATRGRSGRGGRLVGGDNGRAVDLTIDGMLQSLQADRLLMDIDVDSLARACLSLDRINGTPLAGAHGTLLARNHYRGTVRGVNRVLNLASDDDGLIYAY